MNHHPESYMGTNEGGSEAVNSAQSTEKSEHAQNVERELREIQKAVNSAQPGPTSPTRGVEPIRRFFDYAHLPTQLQSISRPFSVLADKILELPASAERTVALRKLLESKDATVRAALPT